MSTLFTDRGGPYISEKVVPVRPTEILCKILQFAVGPDGVKPLLPFTHVSVQWRRAALDDSSLWTNIHLGQTTPPLLDMILTHAGNQLLTVYVDHPDFGRLAKLWNLVDRIEDFIIPLGSNNWRRFSPPSAPRQTLRFFAFNQNGVYWG